MKYYIIAGERSGDLHASNLIKSLKTEDASANFRALGGDLMKAEGADLYRYYHEINYMGVWEVAKNIRIILKNLKECQKDILSYQPDVLILVDFGGFNMKMAKFAKQHNIKTFYYISPKVWAWNTKRAYKIKKDVDRMFVILPFEKEFFKQFNYEVDYVGNPVLDSISEFIPDNSLNDYFNQFKQPKIAILPGSRKYEVENMFSVIGDVVKKFPNYKFFIAAVNSLPTEYYENFQKKYPQVEILYEKTYDLLHRSQAAIVTSGTASLETALLQIPHMVVFKANPVSYFIAMLVLKIQFVSLPNLIAGKEVVKEFLQKKFSPDNVSNHLEELLNDNKIINTQLNGYKEIRKILGTPGTANLTAKKMYQYLTNDIA
ncbi:MAG: lipid-A-disaccharide synthase [Cytophagales bacterium]|nr:MAG: lipid-A-disaccharide synthase [Cytophagales bacterium]